jgi:hypothetical protein
MDKIKIASEKGYIVNNNGEVFYKDRKRKLNFKTCKNQYAYFNVRINGKPTRIEVHRLQAYQKYGDMIFENDIVVRHLNGNGKDNSYENIGIGTQQENILDIPKEKRVEHAKYASSFMKKYSHEDVYEFYQKTKSYKETMEHFEIPSKNGLFFIIKKFKQNNEK